MIRGAKQTSAWLMTQAVTAGPQAQALVRHYGQLLQAKVVANASGRPGPNVITGDYRRSITVDFLTDATGPAAVVSTNKEQGPRLEWGFIGTDSAGRHVSQAPYAHFGPAAADIEPLFVDAIARIGDDE